MLTYRGKIMDATFLPVDMNEYKKGLSTLNDKKVIVVIKQDRPIRSLKSNALYWLYLTAIAEYSGHTTDELHEFFKLKFLPRRFLMVLGEEIQAEPSTTGLDDKQFSEYLEQIQADIGVPIPDQSLLL